MAVHELKTWPSPFQALLDGVKTYEIRRQDRPYKVGDVLHLREWDPNRRTFDRARMDTTNASSTSTDTTGSRFYVVDPHYTGRELRVEVTFMTNGGEWGLPKGVCVMAIRKIEKEQP